MFITGAFNGSLNFGGGNLTSAGNTDVFIAKFDAAGNHLWSKRFGDASSQRGAGVALDAAGDVVLTGTSSGQVNFGGANLSGAEAIFVAKFDPSGNHLWSKLFGNGPYRYVREPAVDSAGNVIITGPMSGSIDFGGGTLTSAGNEDVFLAKLDASGNHVWSKRFGDASGQQSHGVVTDSANDIIVTGSFNGSIDFGGGPLPSGYLFVSKFDPAGSLLGARSFVGGIAAPSGMAVDASGAVFLGGWLISSVDFGGGTLTSAGGFDVFLAKLAP